MFDTLIRSIKSLMHREVRVSGIFFPDDTNNPSTTYIVGRGFTVVRSDVGKYTITFTNVGVKLLGIKAQLQLPVGALADKMVVPCEYDSSAKTLVLQIVQTSDGTTPAEGTAYNANQSISFEATFIDSTVDY